MADVEGKSSYSAEDLDSSVDTFEDVPDAPKHPDDNFDAAAHLAKIVEVAKADNGGNK